MIRRPPSSTRTYTLFPSPPLSPSRVPPGSSGAVVGLGGVGLNALLAAQLAGAARIVAVDVVDDKLALARQLGATDTFNAAEEGAVEAICAATDRKSTRLNSSH